MRADERMKELDIVRRGLHKLIDHHRQDHHSFANPHTMDEDVLSALMSLEFLKRDTLQEIKHAAEESKP